MKQLEIKGDSPSLVTLQDGSLLLAYRNLPDTGPRGIGLALSRDGGDAWQFLGNIRDQVGWDMGYPDLISLADGRVLCVFYTDAEARMISAEERETLSAREPMRTIFRGPMRPRAYEEPDGAIRGIFLRDISTCSVCSSSGCRQRHDEDRQSKTML